MFTGLTRQEQGAIFVLVAIIVGGMAINQWRARDTPGALVIDAETEEVIAEPSDFAPREANTPQSAEATSAGLIDLNTATLTELMTLPGVGESRARAIIDHRTSQGLFHAVEEVMEIGGIGEGIFSRIQSQITIGASALSEPQVTQAVPVEAIPRFTIDAPPMPLVATGLVNVNTASATQLETLPGIGPVLAGRIITERASGGPFRTVEDLQRVSGIGEARAEALRPLVTF